EDAAGKLYFVNPTEGIAPGSAIA
ncbi:MAG: hypothetical protein RLY15_1355, partial [Bacteroidota bacterium]